MAKINPAQGRAVWLGSLSLFSDLLVDLLTMHGDCLRRVYPDSDLIASDGLYNYLDFITEANGRRCSLCVVLSYV